MTLSQLSPEASIFPKIPGLSQQNRVIFSDYINYIHKSEPQIFEYIETIIKGYMIANALYLPDPYNVNRKFNKTKIFFDTSFLIYALGYSGEEMRAPCLELLELLHVNGSLLYCFRHTVEEIKGILHACSVRLGKPNESIFGRSVQYFTVKGYTQSDIQLLISSLERNLEYLRIRIIDKPEYSDHQSVIDETEFSDTLKKNMSFPKEGAISKDVDSVSAIYRIRRGETSLNIEDSIAIFVTTIDVYQSLLSLRPA